MSDPRREDWLAPADPGDGHTYRPRYTGKDRADGLRDEYEAYCAR